MNHTTVLILYPSQYFGIAVLKILEKYLKYLNTSINWISFKEGQIIKQKKIGSFFGTNPKGEQTK